MGFFDLLSPDESRHWRRLLFHWSVHHASTFLRPLAPRPLRRFVATTDALTPVPRGSSAPIGYGRMNAARLVRDRSPCFMYQHFRPFRLQSPSRPRHRFTGGFRLPARYPSARRASLKERCSSRVWASPLSGRLATVSGRIEFTCVSDWSFTSSCSPPGLAATQLLSVTGRRTYARRGLAPLNADTHTGAPKPLRGGEDAVRVRPRCLVFRVMGCRTARAITKTPYLL